MKAASTKLHMLLTATTLLLTAATFGVSRETGRAIAAAPVATEIVRETEYVEVEVPVDYSFYKDIELSDFDRTLLAKILVIEAGNQSITGQRAVVEVVFNRMLDSRFPNTLTEVIYAPNQFASVKALGQAKPTQVQYDVIDMVLNESAPVLPENVVYFATTPANGIFYEKIGGHCFCY